MTTTPAFDPQHDARFQRGYDPGTAAAPGGDADPRAVAAASVVDAPGEGPADFVRDGDGAADLPSTPGRNPFVIALWVLGPLLLIGGLGLVLQSASSNSYGYSGGDIPWSMVLQQLGWALAPSMLSTGLATIMGLLFWHAFSWHRARSAAAVLAASPTTAR